MTGGTPTKGAEGMRKLLRASVLLTVAAAVFAAAAQGAKPVRAPAGSPPPADFPAGLVCSFPVHVEVAEHRQTDTIFSDGSIVRTGFSSTLVRNAAEPENELILNTQGRQHITFEGDNLRLRTQGPILFFFFPGDKGPGDESEGRTYLITGNTEVLVDPNFTFLSFSYSGRARDICAELA